MTRLSKSKLSTSKGDKGRRPKGPLGYWLLQDAKARFSEVIRRAVDEGPQHVSVRGEPAAVVLSEQEYRQLTSKRPSIVDHMLAGEPWPDDGGG